MFLSDLATKRPVLATVMSLVLVVLGLVAALLIEVRQYPEVDPPVVSVTTVFRGAPADVVDADVTKRIVDVLAGLEDVRYIDATSSEQRSQITIEFLVGRDLDEAAASVRNRISRVRAELPEAVEDPQVAKASANADPILWLGMTSDELTALELNDYAERVIVDQLETVSGVSRVFIGGERRYAMRLWLDRERMTAKNVTVSDIANRLRAENIEVPSGRIESAARELSVRTLSRFENPEDFRRMVIRDDGQNRVRVADVARVELGAENYRTLLRNNDEPAVGLGIVRRSDANSLEVVDGVRALLPTLRRQLPGSVNLEINHDESKFIRQSIREVLKTLALAIGLVVLVILAFLGSLRTILVPAVAIPVSLIAPLFIAYLAGFTINVLTLLAAVLAIGLVVDDSVVVLENITRRREQGEPPLLAAARGASEVSFAVIATTAVLVAVFLPLAFLSGRVGRLFTEFSLILAATVIVSSFVALTLSPMLSSKLIPAPKQPSSDTHPGWQSRIRHLAQRATGGYQHAVAAAICHRWLSLAVAALIAATAVGLFRLLPSTLAPREDQGVFFVFVEGPEGASLEYTNTQAKQIEQIIAEQDESWNAIKDRLTLIPSFGANPSLNEAAIICVLKDWDQRDISQQQMVRTLFPKLRALPGCEAFAVNPASLGLEGATRPVQFVIQGLEYRDAFDASERVMAAVEDSPVFRSLSSDYRPTKPELRVRIDRDRATQLGLNAATIGESLQAFFGGLEVTEYFDAGELYEVVLEGTDTGTDDPTSLQNVYVRGRGEALVPLKNVVSLSEGGTPRTLRRVDKLPAVVLSGSPAFGRSLGQALAELERVADRELPRQARVSYLGRSLEYKETSYRLYLVFGLALLVAYLVLAAQFESFVDPLTIMVAVPLAVTGGLLALTLAGMTLNIFSQIGMILLIGIVAKNGILLVEFANQRREQDPDLSVADAARHAARIRLRPILMTAISTVLGALPLALASGAGAEGRQAIGVVIIGGMILATALTLLVVPALYRLLGPLSKPKNAVARELERQRQAQPAG